PAIMVIARLPKRPTSHPAKGSESTEPAAIARRTAPSCPSLSPWRPFTAGMCGTQLAITAPLTKKTVATAQRARVSIDLLETRESAGDSFGPWPPDEPCESTPVSQGGETIKKEGAH